MSTVVATPSAAPMPPLDRNPSPRSYPPLAPMNNGSIPDRASGSTALSETPHSGTPNKRASYDGRKSPRSAQSNSVPKVIVKQEPLGSPSMQNNRHRPRKLELNTTSSVPGPLSSRASAGLGLHEVGLACLSPGFQTQDPTMREQLQRSISVRDQQRSIIESRLLKSAKGDGPDNSKAPESSFGKPGMANSKKRPPPGLSIVPPAAERFANERVIQSAPLGQTFTGRNQAHPVMRTSEHQPSGLSQNPNIHPVAAMQNNNRLPPISDVFGSEALQNMPSRPPFLHANTTPSQSNGPPLPSPGFPPQTAHPMSQPAQSHQFDRPREYRSAEDAVHELTGGREDLQPKLIRYGGRQPPTPPSPTQRGNDHLTPHKYQPAFPDNGFAGRRRSRHEYEGDSSPPLGNGPDRGTRQGPFGAGRDSPATQQAKKDEFLSLCSRAWDLFHS